MVKKNEIDEKATELARDIENEYGPEVLLKVSFSALTKLLVDKRLISRQDLNAYFIEFAEVAKKEIEGL
jgi:hypothetical protein